MSKEHHQPQEQSEPQEPWAGGVESAKNWTREEKLAFLEIAYERLVDYKGNLLCNNEPLVERKLIDLELVDFLEEAGILPKWGDEGLREADRGVVLDYLYAGAVLGHAFGEEILSHLKNPDSSFPWVSDQDRI